LGKGLESIQEHLKADIYLFDGNQTFGVLGINTMVKADGKIPEVSAASILAKVTHDRAIIEASKIYKDYGFEKHKGYGTKAHVEAIKRYGFCKIHRRSFKVKGLD
jgi:ribonuclease HII